MIVKICNYALKAIKIFVRILELEYIIFKSKQWLVIILKIGQIVIKGYQF